MIYAASSYKLAKRNKISSTLATVLNTNSTLTELNLAVKALLSYVCKTLNCEAKKGCLELYDDREYFRALKVNTTLKSLNLSVCSLFSGQLRE